MSLKITDSNGFVIGGVLNPSVTVIYVRALSNQQKEQKIEGQEKIEIQTNARVSENGGRFDTEIKVDFIYKSYWTKYSTDIEDANEQLLEIETDLINQILVANPNWVGKIEIVNIPS